MPETKYVQSEQVCAWDRKLTDEEIDRLHSAGDCFKAGIPCDNHKHEVEYVFPLAES